MPQFRAQQSFIQDLFGVTIPLNICFGRKEVLLQAPLPGSIQFFLHVCTQQPGVRNVQPRSSEMYFKT